MNEKRMNELSKIFRDGPIAISRQDYESMPCPMAALLVSDDGMQAIAWHIHAKMLRDGWSEDQLERMLGSDDDTDDVEMCNDEFWRTAERAAISFGMKYREDLPANAV